MAQESFYGGRQGASCVIVKSYPDIASMVNEFEQGGSTVREVNYGEYVLINTLDKNDEDNGKLFRRGMDTNNEFGGGIYLGQIRGPEGKVRAINLTSYNNQEIIDKQNTVPEDYKGSGDQTPTSGDLVPGKEEENEQIIYNDKIQYKYINITDSDGNITKILAGFKFPYMVIDFSAERVNPYYSEDLITRVDDKTHPFQEEWHLKVPNGKKGDSIIELGIYPTIVPPNTQFYDNLSPDGTPSGENRLPEDVTGFIVISEYRTNQNYIKFNYSGSQVGYAIRSTINYNQELHYGCLKVNYDNAEPNYTQIDIGEYRTIHHINLDEKGKVEIFYNASNPYIGENNPDVAFIRTLANIQIDTGETEGVGDQLIHTYWQNGEDQYGNPIYEDVPIGNPLNYVIEMDTSEKQEVDESRLLVWYSDPQKRGNITHKGKNGQVDLGNVKGNKGGISIITRVATEDDLYFDGSARQRPKKPEDFRQGCEGWCVTVALTDDDDQVIYSYDYNNNKQYALGDLSVGSLDPSLFIAVNAEATPPIGLRNHGIQLCSNTRKCAYKPPVQINLVSQTTGSNEDIAKMIDGYYNGDLSLADIQSVQSVGDTRTITLSAMEAIGVSESHRSQNVDIQILDFEHDDLTNAIGDKTKALITVDLKNCLRDATVADNDLLNNSENGYMNSTYTNVGSQRNSARRAWCNNVFYNAIPDYLKTRVKLVDKKTAPHARPAALGEEVLIDSDYVFLLAGDEVNNNGFVNNFIEGTKYQYYLLATENYIKLPIYEGGMMGVIDYQLRSPTGDRSNYTDSFAGIMHGSGTNVQAQQADNKRGIAPAFCL